MYILCSFSSFSSELQVLVINLPYVESTIGTPCKGDNDCVLTSEACNPLGFCQCKAGYSNYSSDCLKGSGLGGPCQNRSECVGEYFVCNTTIAFGTCMCNPYYFYEYQGSCHEKHPLYETCYTADSCFDINSMCSNSSGGICVCKTDYSTVRAICTKKSPLGGYCFSDERCINEHAQCNAGMCFCEDAFYAHQGFCIPRSALGGTCQNDDGCTGDHVVCDNGADVGVCICNTGYYEHQGFCYGKAGLGGMCQSHDGCTGDGVVCSSVYNGTCVCNSSYIPHQETCHHMPDSPKNLLALNVTSRSFIIGFEKPNEVFGELLGYVLKITLSETGRCVIEYLIRCTTGCVAPYPNQTVLSTSCSGIIQARNVSKNDLVVMKYNINTLDPDTVYWVSAAGVSQYGKGYTADISVTTLHEGDVKVGSNSESNTMTTVIIVSIVCGTLMAISLIAAGTVIIIRRKFASKSKNDADTGSTYVDLACRTNETSYENLIVNAAY